MQLLSIDTPPVAFVGGFYGRMLSTTPDQTRMGFGHCFTRREPMTPMSSLRLIEEIQTQ